MEKLIKKKKKKKKDAYVPMLPPIAFLLPLEFPLHESGPLPAKTPGSPHLQFVIRRSQTIQIKFSTANLDQILDEATCPLP
jgi:hypothetical protein